MNTLTGKAKAFSDACYDNSIEELEAALIGGCDKSDCAEWGITESEWFAAIEVALTEKLGE